MLRQKKYICGDFLDIEIYNRPANAKPFARARKVHESSDAQKNLNNKKSQRYFVRLVHCNFVEDDLYVDLTYSQENLPEDKDEIRKDVRNYVSRLKRARARSGITEPLKYIYVISNCDNMGNKVRFHVHMIINNMDRDIAEQCWGKGFCNTDRIRFDECGATGKSLYMARQAKGDRSWSGSQNLIKPDPIISDRAVTYTKAMQMERTPEDRQMFERMYPGWIFTDCTIERDNDEMPQLNGTRFYIRMRRYPNGGRKRK